jgi:hypothetical protein
VKPFKGRRRWDQLGIDVRRSKKVAESGVSYETDIWSLDGQPTTADPEPEPQQKEPESE